MFDGEGHVSVREGKACSVDLGLAQRQGPIRLMNKLLSSDCDFEEWLRPDSITGIEAIGETELIEVRTSTRTIFAEGFAARGCSE